MKYIIYQNTIKLLFLQTQYYIAAVITAAATRALDALQIQPLARIDCTLSFSEQGSKASSSQPHRRHENGASWRRFRDAVAMNTN